MDPQTSHFISEAITVEFDIPPVIEKTPFCPDRFVWRDETYAVADVLSEWQDFRRRGRMASNMRPENLAKAARRGSWGVGRFYFRVRTGSGRVFDIYYDRAPASSDDGGGSWVLYCEWDSETDEEDSSFTVTPDDT